MARPRAVKKLTLPVGWSCAGSDDARFGSPGHEAANVSAAGRRLLCDGVGIDAIEARVEAHAALLRHECAIWPGAGVGALGVELNLILLL
jgi:hypothetical protein